MTKKHFIRLAQYIKGCAERGDPLTEDQIYHIASFCKEMNPSFNMSRWLDYIAGKCGPSGGRIR